MRCILAVGTADGVTRATQRGFEWPMALPDTRLLFLFATGLAVNRCGEPLAMMFGRVMESIALRHSAAGPMPALRSVDQ